MIDRIPRVGHGVGYGIIGGAWAAGRAGQGQGRGVAWLNGYTGKTPARLMVLPYGVEKGQIGSFHNLKW